MAKYEVDLEKTASLNATQRTKKQATQKESFPRLNTSKKKNA